MLKASYTPYILHFKVPSGTSRGVLTQKETYFLKVWDEHNPDCFGIGECALFKGLGADDRPDYEARFVYMEFYPFWSGDRLTRFAAWRTTHDLSV